MEAMKCMECGEEMEQRQTGRPKRFCSVSCRSNFWQKEKRKEAELYRALKTTDTPEMKAVRKQTADDLMNYGRAITKTTTATTERLEPSIENVEILAQIKAIRDEKIPDLRNKSAMGQKSWAIDQKKRIQELESKLK